MKTAISTLLIKLGRRNYQQSAASESIKIKRTLDIVATVNGEVKADIHLT
jgi:hypothetical protein